MISLLNGNLFIFSLVISVNPCGVSTVVPPDKELNMLVSTMNYERLCLSLQEICRSMHKILSEHFQQEETELWGMSRDCFAIEEQEKIIGCMLGRISGEILQDMIPWSIYHCPYCNLCRVGEGLGIDYFHCMKCNACMSCSLTEHVCGENWLEVDCPICHGYIFTSKTVVKPLPCGHLMHSTCFQEYTRSHYTCPVCSKSLGDMQMLDTLLAEEKMPDEYANKTQVILCNECGRKGDAPYHWLYHKCTSCGSYNSKLL
ncbi:hypothetical protein N665_0937s0018 [Sinapis alba]|nr:hypothetical protein N665_0937s0018 [Sinapis alba]